MTDITLITSVATESNVFSELVVTNSYLIFFDSIWFCYKESMKYFSSCLIIRSDGEILALNFLSKWSSEDGCSWGGSKHFILNGSRWQLS